MSKTRKNAVASVTRSHAWAPPSSMLLMTTAVTSNTVSPATRMNDRHVLLNIDSTQAFFVKPLLHRRRHEHAHRIGHDSIRLAIFLERQLAVMLPQKIQKALVLARFHVEEARHDLVVAARLLEAATHDIANVLPGDFTGHVHRIHGRPE